MASKQDFTAPVRDVRRMADTLAMAGFAFGTEVDTVIVATGPHSPLLWKREFPNAYKWLFNSPVAARVLVQKTAFEVYPNPGVNGRLRVRASANQKNGAVVVYNSLGEQVRKATMVNGRAEIDVDALPAGVYRVRVGGSVNAWVKQ
jgi:metallo-beta-lactamase class B